MWNCLGELHGRACGDRFRPAEFRWDRLMQLPHCEQFNNRVRPDHCVRAAIAASIASSHHSTQYADARAAFAENAPLRIIGDHGREILFGPGRFSAQQTVLPNCPIKGQLLQFASPPRFATGQSQRMIGRAKTRRSNAACSILRSCVTTCRRCDDRARGLQLRHLLNGTRHMRQRLQSQVGVVAERRNVELIFATDIDQARTLGT